MSRLDGFRTLLLDSTFRPLRAISWKRAIILDMQDRVDVVEYYDEVVRTPSTALPLPAVVRLRQYLRVLRRGVAFTRRNVLMRDTFECQYCGDRPGYRELTLDHVVPRSRGGVLCWENVVTACQRCNRRKGSRTPHEARMRLLRLPKRPTFLPVVRAGADEEAPVEWVEYLHAVGG
ncbi:MAG: HNH endonuclease [Deltaproteobacteria bacterium]|nr:HNH endonuclease [Deltaproteobacteria bacterium]